MIGWWTKSRFDSDIGWYIGAEVPACRQRRTPTALWHARKDATVRDVVSTQSDRRSAPSVLPQVAARTARTQLGRRPWQVVQSQPIARQFRLSLFFCSGSHPLVLEKFGTICNWVQKVLFLVNVKRVPPVGFFGIQILLNQILAGEGGEHSGKLTTLSQTP